MKRFKTKQEMKRDDVSYSTNYAYALGLPFDKIGTHEIYPELKKRFSMGTIVEEHLTTDPHPFDSMDIKVRVTPKQLKKLQKKARKMGYVDEGVEFASYETEDIVLYILQGKIDGFNRATNTSYLDRIELTYKQFMNGSIPKEKKREFKVGDWVEVMSGYSGDPWGVNIGDIVQISKLDNFNKKHTWVQGPDNKICFCKKNLKHTTKPKEQPLKFKCWDVTIGEKSVQIGCERFSIDELVSYLRIGRIMGRNGVELTDFFSFLEANKSKLGL